MNAYSSADASVVFDGVYKTYGRRGAEVAALQDVSLQIEPSEIVALLGPNGAGKTTLVKALGRLINIDAGRITIGDEDVLDRRRPLRTCSIVLEGGQGLLEDLTPMQNLLYFGELAGVGAAVARARAPALLRRLNLESKRDTAVRKLSRGMRQALTIGAGLMHSPRYLVLDEPTLGLDPAAVLALKGLLRELRHEGLGILMTTHDLPFVEATAERAVILHEGRVVHRCNVRKDGEALEFHVWLDRELPLAVLPAKACFTDTRRELRIPCAAAEFAEIVGKLRDFGIRHIETRRPSLMDAYLRVLDMGANEGARA